MKQLNLGSLSIPMTQYASQGNAVLGIRDSGKSYSATYLAEQLYAAGIPFVAFDPSGVWKFLRVPGAGKGLPVVVAGGKAPDLPLTPQSAPEIVRAAMRSNVSVVFDLYDIQMSKADWSRIVEACVRVLLYENGEHGLRHVFIEEAPEFAPQLVTQEKARVYAEVEKLARIGGNALLGYTLIGQRAEQVNKAVLELCDCLFLHRQKGKNSIKSLEKWLELSTGGDVKSIIAGLPTLPNGQCWVWPANAEHATLVKMPSKNTYHPDRRALIANPAAANVKRVDASVFVSELKGSLEKFVEEAKANDPALLKRRIAELERDLRKPRELAVDVDALAREKKEGFKEGVSATALEIANRFVVLRSTINESAEAISRNLENYFKALATLEVSESYKPVATTRAFLEPAAAGSHTRSMRSPEQSRAAAAADREQRVSGSSSPLKPRNGRAVDLPRGEAATLAACIQFPDVLRREQLTVLTGYKRSSRDAYIQRLRERGYVENRGDMVTATEAGCAAMPDAEPLPTGIALQEYWLTRLPEGERKVLGVLIDRYPKAVRREDIDEKTGYQRSSRDAYLQRLRAKQLIAEHGRGEVIASQELF